MARIAGVDLPRTKRVEVGLTYIYGIGRKRSNDILTEAEVSPDIRVKDLSEEDVRKISRVIEEQGRVEGDLRKEISMNIKRLMEIGSWRGMRHRRNLPVRGQRTRTNARTRKGPRKGAVAKKKTVELPASSCQLPVNTRDWERFGSGKRWELEAGNWKLIYGQKRPD